MGDTTSYKISAIEMGSGCDIKLTVTPTFADEGYDFGDLVGYFIYAYNDTVTDTAQAAGNQPIFNKPLEITIQGSNYIYVWADSFWVADQADEEYRHLDTNTLFKLMAPPTSEKLVYAGVWDSLHAVGNGSVDTCDNGSTYPCHQWVNAYDSSQTWTKNELNFGIYDVRKAGSTANRLSNIFLRADANGEIYAQIFYDRSCGVWAQEDSFEIYRLYSSTIADVPKYHAYYQDRQWLAGYSDAPNYLKYSSLFESEADSSLGTYYIYVAEDDGDIITSLFTLPFQDLLCVGKKKHLYTISGEGPYDWWVNDVAGGIGVASDASVVVHNRLAYFYDYTGFYAFDGTEAKKISWAIEPIVADSINTDYAHLIVGGYFDQHIWWSYPSGSATTNNRTVVFNIEDAAWGTIDRDFSAVFVDQIETKSKGVLWGDPDSGKVYEYGQTYFDDGVSYNTTYESGWLDMGDQSEYVKDFKDFQMLFDKHDTSVVYLWFYKDYSDTAFAQDTVDADASDIFRFFKRQLRDYDDRIGMRIKVKMQLTRADGISEIAFFQFKWKPVGEAEHDGD